MVFLYSPVPYGRQTDAAVSSSYLRQHERYEFISTTDTFGMTSRKSDACLCQLEYTDTHFLVFGHVIICIYLGMKNLYTRDEEQDKEKYEIFDTFDA